MHFMYERINGNSIEALGLNRKCFLNRKLPNLTTFERLHRKISETSLFRAKDKIQVYLDYENNSQMKAILEVNETSLNEAGYQ